jgi:Ser/Thr protein kinase RdoA (MazF antagonist)
VELVASGRTSEVFAYGAGRVLKLDRPEWNGLSAFEATVLDQLAAAGLPVARAHGAVTVDGRGGVILDRVDGPSLLEVITASSPSEVERLVGPFVALQLQCNATTVSGLPALVPRLRTELESSVTDAELRTGLVALLTDLDALAHGDADGDAPGDGVCHFDFHPSNVLIARDGWVVIDWLTVAVGPSAADLARTLVLWGQRTTGPLGDFLRAVRREGRRQRGLDDDVLDAWVRVVAAARVAEGFEGAERAWLLGVAAGAERLFV